MNKYVKLAFIIIFPIVFLLSLWGFRIRGIEWFDSVYISLQLLTLNGSLDKVGLPIPWQLELSRFLLPIFTLSAIISLLYEKIVRQLLLIKQTLFPHEIVLIGAGKTARAICRRIAKGKRILIIDPELPENQIKKLGVNHKVSFIAGDGQDVNLIRKLSLDKSKTIYVFTGDDKKDLRIALLLAELFTAKVKSSSGVRSKSVMKNALPRLIVDIDDQKLLKVAIHDSRLKKYREHGELIWFSSVSQAARRVVWEHPVLKVSSKGRENIHIGFVGFNSLQEQVLLQVLRTSAYLYCSNIQISIFDISFEKFKKFTLKNPALFELNSLGEDNYLKLAKIEFYQVDVDFAFQKQMKEALGEGSSKNEPDIIYVNDDSDFSCLNKVQRTVQTLVSLNKKVRVIGLVTGSELETRENLENLWCEFESEITASLDKNGADKIEKVYNENVFVSLFHCKDDLVVENEDYPGEKHASLGLEIHKSYVESIKESKPDLDFDAEKDWKKQLSKAYIWSNLFAADHLPIKVRELLSYELSEFNDNPEKIEKLTSYINDNYEALTELEHKRFLMERLVDGWLFSESNLKALQLNSTLRPFDMLPSNEVSKDRKMIEVLIKLIVAYNSK